MVLLARFPYVSRFTFLRLPWGKHPVALAVAESRLFPVLDHDHAVILIVDDRQDDFLLMRHGFHRAGLLNPLHWVSSGEEAIQYLNGSGRYSHRVEHPLPDLILLDLKMLGMDGFEVLTWIRRQPGIRILPVVVLTSSEQIQDVNHAYSLGANSFLVKPLDFMNYAELAKILRDFWLKCARRPEILRPPPKPNGPARKH
jgi:CheY-like chemotaxis protein